MKKSGSFTLLDSLV
jgi:acetolactate synthase-1/2/3 large subunit